MQVAVWRRGQVEGTATAEAHCGARGGVGEVQGVAEKPVWLGRVSNGRVTVGGRGGRGLVGHPENISLCLASHGRVWSRKGSWFGLRVEKDRMGYCSENPSCDCSTELGFFLVKRILAEKPQVFGFRGGWN